MSHLLHHTGARHVGRLGLQLLPALEDLELLDVGGGEGDGGELAHQPVLEGLLEGDCLVSEVDPGDDTWAEMINIILIPDS